tara:strand:+ start:719 stop:2980 length:2262 start_codon:yes stop_codon:yes gene_type:complete
LSTSYDRNIERLKANQREISAQEQRITTQSAQERGEAGIKHAEDIATKLTPFSTALREWKQKSIEKQLEIGRQEREKTKLENAKWMAENGSSHQQQIIAIEKAREAGELAKGFETAAAQDDMYQKLSRELLKRDGVKAFPDADRIAKLSPWAQVGYVQESIKQKKAAAQDMINQAMQNSTEELKLGGITFTPKEVADNNLAYPMKEHALEILSDKIYRNLGLDKYSDAMLERAKVPEHFRNIKESIRSKYRQRYTIEASMQTQAKADLALQNSEYTASDIQKYLLTVGNTTNSKGVLLMNSGAWAMLEKHFIKQGMKHEKGVTYGNFILDKPMPDSMCRELGVPYGTTFAKQWPQRVNSINNGIKDAIAEAVNAEDKYLDSLKTNIENQFRQEASTRFLDADDIEGYRQRFTNIGQKAPDWLVNYETVSKRSERLDAETLENIVAQQGGFITHQTLDRYHPNAALKYRKDADRHEAALKKTHNVGGTIKAALNNSWADAGIKTKEKSVVWEYALGEANKDFELKVNKLVSVGYTHDEAVQTALYASLGSVKNKDTGEVIPDFEGVVAEIQRNGANSKYTEFGETVKASVKDADIRVSKIREAKEEMLYNKDAILNKVVGGKYGNERINEIIQAHKNAGGRPENIWQAINDSPEALAYYEGLARGKRGLTTYALIDAQLKASGLHPGIWPDRKEEKDETGIIEADSNALEETKYEGDLVSYINVTTNSEERERFLNGEGSAWNTSDNLASWVTV